MPIDHKGPGACEIQKSRPPREDGSEGGVFREERLRTNAFCSDSSVVVASWML